MSDPIAAVVLTAFLSVGHVGENRGFPQTPDGAYVCGFDRASYAITKAGLINVVFVPSTPQRFKMRSAEIVNDSKSSPEYSTVQIAERSLQISAANRTPQAIYFSVILEDTDTGKVFECDPQVINTPVPT